MVRSSSSLSSGSSMMPKVLKGFTSRRGQGLFYTITTPDNVEGGGAPETASQLGSAIIKPFDNVRGNNWNHEEQLDPLADLRVVGLDPSVTEAVLFELFYDIGQRHSIRVERDQITGRSLGSATVRYKNASDAAKAEKKLNGTTIKGRLLAIIRPSLPVP
ncbi:hypothetical protein B0T24DRAFT_599400 [Lasiosphaeria ovina]|uniref:RRM domain-containing protein n=1 Tax=Lasiosphaeria ovina TaxID=92902 RepID=A0AAE0JTP0_9PEZI|nr:hypothetical protein B0T24DRAFT_599400 [Lasiosphaeria ovina]